MLRWCGFRMSAELVSGMCMIFGTHDAPIGHKLLYYSYTKTAYTNHTHSVRQFCNCVQVILLRFMMVPPDQPSYPNWGTKTRNQQIAPSRCEYHVPNARLAGGNRNANMMMAFRTRIVIRAQMFGSVYFIRAPKRAIKSTHNLTSYR